MIDNDEMGTEWQKGWTTKIHHGIGPFAQTTYVWTTGPASWRIDDEGNLHVEETLTDGTEVVVATVLASHFMAVTQEKDEEPDTVVAADDTQVSSDGINVDRKDPW